LKKTSKQKQLLRQRIARKRWRRTLSKRRRNNHTQYDIDRQRLALPDNAASVESTRSIVVKVPGTLDLRQQRKSTLQFVAFFRKAVLIHNKRVVLNFVDTVSISPTAMLLLLAEIDRCRRLRPRASLTGTYPKNESLHRHMQACGFFKLLKIKHQLPEVTKVYPRDYIQFMTGTESVGKDAEDLRTALLGPDHKWTRAAGDAIYRGLTEAMTNVVQHAYPSSALTKREPRLKNRWWMVGHTDRRKKELKILFFDSGVGIPFTLPKRLGWEVIRSVIGSLGITPPNDSEMIRAAMQLGRSTTELGNRGKGLNDFKKLIDACHDGQLEIYSNKGVYQYSYRDEESRQDHHESICGTLIEWSMPLAAIENWEPGENDGSASHV
jgi:anti-anti-sigma regulatory factor